MTAKVIYLTRREPTPAEAHVIRLAERADFAERATLMAALGQSIVKLKEIAEFVKERDGRK